MRGPEAYSHMMDVEGRTARGRTSATFVRASETVSWLEPPSASPPVNTRESRVLARRSSDSVIAVEQFVNNAGFIDSLPPLCYPR